MIDPHHLFLLALHTARHRGSGRGGFHAARGAAHAARRAARSHRGGHGRGRRR